MTQSFAFDPLASQETNERFVRSLANVTPQAEAEEKVEAEVEVEVEAEVEAEVVEDSEQKESSRPTISLRQSSRRRARTGGGRFAADNPETPQNEAWE